MFVIFTLMKITVSLRKTEDVILMEILPIMKNVHLHPKEDWKLNFFYFKRNKLCLIKIMDDQQVIVSYSNKTLESADHEEEYQELELDKNHNLREENTKYLCAVPKVYSYITLQWLCWSPGSVL